MKKGLILINAYCKLASQLNQSTRLQEEFSKLGIDVDVKRNNYFQCQIKDNGIVSSGNYDFCIYLDKDKYMSEMLEKTGLRLFNTHQAILDCDDKMCTYIKLADSGLNIVDTLPGLLCYSKDEPIDDVTIDEIERHFGYPVIVKECYGSLGKGVYKCDNRAELREMMERLKMTPHLFERFVRSSMGRDIRVIVIGGKAVTAMVRHSNGDFRSNLELGGYGEPIEIDESIRRQAEGATRVLGLDYAGVDLLFGENGEYIICEVNSNAFFGGIEKVTGYNVAKAFAEYIIDEVYVDTSIIKDNVNRISITNIAKDRCNKKLNDNALEYEYIKLCQKMILSKDAIITKHGKNWYVEDGTIRFTINSCTYMIITADKIS